MAIVTLFIALVSSAFVLSGGSFLMSVYKFDELEKKINDLQKPGPPSDTPSPTVGSVTPTLLSLYDNTSQQVEGGNLWTTIKFNNQLFESGSWLFSDGGGDAQEIKCLRSNIYSIYLSLQVKPSPLVPVPLECKPCHLKYQLRCVRQKNGEGPQEEIPGSLTYNNGQSVFLAKNFFVDLEEGDVIRFQFISLCPKLALQPSVYNEAMSSLAGLGSSATLLIS